jgi:hypothetical protein
MIHSIFPALVFIAIDWQPEPSETTSWMLFEEGGALGPPGAAFLCGGSAAK